MNYQEIIEGIISLKIQGAEKIAIAAVEAFELKLKETKDAKQLKQSCNELIATRQTEPALRNALSYCMKYYQEKEHVTQEVINHFNQSKQKIAEIGSQKIQNGMIVFTHCHSSAVEAVIFKAWDQGKRFSVYNTETRPKYQGRITASNIAAHGIPVTHFVDSAGRYFLKKADLFLFGCDAVTSEGKIINKIGTEGLAECAAMHHIPSYSVTNSWKFDPKTIHGFEEVIEQRNPNEIWENPPNGIIIQNPAFEIISPNIITGIITEIGIYKPETLVLEVQKNYPWITLNN